MDNPKKSKLWPVLVSAGSASIMLISFLIPSVLDQWDRYQSRKVIEQYVALGDDFFAEERFDMAEKAYEKAFEISEQKRLDVEIKRLTSKINRVTMRPQWGSPPPKDIEEIDFQYVLKMQAGKKHAKERVVTLNSYGVYLAALHKTREAELAFSEATRLDSSDLLAYVNLGNLYDIDKKKDLAEKYYRKAISLDPENGRTHYNLGLFYAEQGRHSDAEKELLLAQKYDPADTDAVRECRYVTEQIKKNQSSGAK
jgi:tetratricopeptide (TPR) repeat protein